MGALGSRGWTTCRFRVPLGAMGAMGAMGHGPVPPDCQVPLGVWPKAQRPIWHPWGGGIHSREARAGVNIFPLFPGYVLPDGPPTLGDH